MKHEPFNESIEMYLKAVHELAHGDDMVPISGLARWLGVSTVSATEMVHRLEEQGLLEHKPYRGIQLTETGSERAAQIIRTHRLWECFLADKLHLSWADAHDYACRLEHATAEAVVDALDVFLGHPTTCPHGNPVEPGRASDQEQQIMPLSDLPVGEGAVVHAIRPESALLLDYLSNHGVRPGQEIVLQEIAPFSGPLMVRVGSAVHAFSEEAAAHIFVLRRPAEDSS
ncbi:MAG TPA: metal-dependent transcriptional regulator [Candidatus Sulfomarinibacteraceae bacterium]|nr:metal-dependent transcriptional regulator [Candidatus Sulfomarinibacteraceae bacterium]